MPECVCVRTEHPHIPTYKYMDLDILQKPRRSAVTLGMQGVQARSFNIHSPCMEGF